MKDKFQVQLQYMYVSTQTAYDLECYRVAYNECRELLGAIRFAKMIGVISEKEYNIATENAYKLYRLIGEKVSLSLL